MYYPSNYAQGMDIGVYVQDELNQISARFVALQDGQVHEVRAAAPKKPRIGCTYYANGTNWNPGAGEGLYVYTSGGYVKCSGGGGGGGVTDHGGLTGLSDDDHTQYFNTSRGDARYSQLGHTHIAANVTDFSEAVDDRVAALLVAGANVTITYDDGANTLTIAASGGGGSSALGLIAASLRI